MLAGYLLVSHHSQEAGGEYKRLRGFRSFKRLRECGLTKSSIVLAHQVTQTLYNPPSKSNLLPILVGYFLSVIAVKKLEANTKDCEVLASLKDYAVTN